MFKKSTPKGLKPSQEPSPGKPSTPQPDPEADKALDTVADLLRTYGKYALDTGESSAEETTHDCERWASSLLVGATRAQNDDGEVTRIRRDWGGAKRFFDATRRQESDYLKRSQSELREAVQQFAACLSHALSADRSGDETLGHQIDSLSTALDSNNPEQVRAEASRVIQCARLVMLERRQREIEQVKVLAEKFNQLKTELVEARTQATTDPLTQLYNNNALLQHLERINDWGILLEDPPSLMLLRVCNLPELQQTHGAAIGDLVIKTIADVLTRCFLRRQDFVARMHAEEFAVVVIETSPESLKRMVDRLLEGVGKVELEHEGQRVEPRVEFGIAELVAGETVDAWSERATAALHEGRVRPKLRMISGG